MSDTSFYGNGGDGVTPAPVTPEGSDTSFYAGTGEPTQATIPFEGVLANSNAHIGTVTVANPTTHVSIDNFPGTQNVNVVNRPAIQQVAVTNQPSVQDVRVTNPVAEQAVVGHVAIDNFPSVQKVELTGSSTILAGLSQGTQHIGSVSIDGPIQGTVTLSNPVTSLSINNFPDTQNVAGTVRISNFPAAPSAITVNNDVGSPVPVRIVASDVALGGGGGGSSNFDGNVVLKAGTAHIGSVNLDQPVTISGTVPVSLASVPTHAVTLQGSATVQGTVNIGNLPSIQTVSLASNIVTLSNLPDTQKVSIANTVSVGGTVAISNPVTSIGINNFPATQAVTGTVALASNSVSVSNAVKVDSTTPLKVEVTNQQSGGSFDGNVTVTGGTLNVGNFPATQPVSGTVTVANPVTSVSINNANSAPVPVSIQGGVSTFDGVLKAGTAHVGNVGIDGPVTVSGTLKTVGWDGSTESTPANHIPVGLYDQSGHLIGVDSNRLPVDTTGVVDIKGYGGYKVSEGGGIPLIGRDDRTTTTPANHLPIGLYNTSGQALGVAVPLTVQGTVTANVAFPTTQAVSITGTPNVTIQGTPTVALASNSVSISNFPTTQAVTGTVSIGGTVNVAQTGRVSLNGGDGTSAVSNTNAIPVSIVGGSTGGGTSFDGQLKQAGNAVTQANPLPTSVGSTTYAESTGTLGIAATFTGATRATPGPGLVFAVRGTNNGAGSMTVRIEGSNDGTTWTILRTSISAANSFAVTATDAVFPFYRGSYVNGSVAQNAPINLYTYFTPQVVDNGYYILGGVVSVTTSAASSLFVTQSQTATMSNISGSITTGGTAQTLVGANSLRKGLWIQNQSSGDLYLYELGTAVMNPPSYRLGPGVYYEYPSHGIPTTAISIIGTTAGQAFAARQW